MQHQETQRPYSPELLAERWQVSPRSIERICKLAQLRCLKVGRAYRIPADAVTEYEAKPLALKKR
jgi:hypothetical protein